MAPELALGSDPVTIFTSWYAEALAAGDPFPDAMTLATASPEGRPSARVVLYKGLSEGHVRFFTNYRSRKAHELESNPVAALVFHWTSLSRQVRIEGRVERLSETESDAYFASRDRESQLGAWASEQSEPITSREQLDARYAEVNQRFLGLSVPRPPHWGGYRLIASRFEFWVGRTHRLHDRILYRLSEGGWQTTLLSP
jgi:pyridoxamine 5'-phosphate oxidase